LPAIQPAQLQKQSAELAAQITNPTEFVRKLHHYLDLYADYAHRAGQAGNHPTLIYAYGVRFPVIRQLEKDITPFINENPTESLELCDVLWEQPVLEFRQISAYILGLINPPSFNSIIDRIKLFINKEIEDKLIDELLVNGLATARTNHPDSVYRLIDDWFGAKDPFFVKIGLRTLIPFSKEERIKNLPIIYKIIQPYVRNHSLEYFPDLTELIDVLAHQSPQETGHFLSQTLELTNSPDTSLLIRQCINSFPPAIQISLRDDLRRYRSQQFGE
jgi:hypothetical protein